MSKTRIIILALIFVACSSTLIGQKKETPQDKKKGEFMLIDNTNLDTLTLVFHGSYNYDYYRIFINGFLFDDGLLYSMDGREIPHKSVNIIYQERKVEVNSSISVEVYCRSEKLSGSYSPLWGEMNISQTVFENTTYKSILSLDSIGNHRVFKVSNSGSKLSITPIKKGAIWD